MVPEQEFCALIKAHLAGLNHGARLAYLARLLAGSKYGWGKETLGDTDCSGSVSWSLWLLGYRLRTTAHGYWEWSKPIKGLPQAGDLAFWWSKNGDRVVHVAIFNSHFLVMDTTTDFKDIPVGYAVEKRPDQGYTFNRFEWELLAAKSREGSHAYGVDSAIKPLLGLFQIERNLS